MGYKVVITSGGTSEKIDNVRRITNNSSGKLGCTIAKKILEFASDKIDKIYYISTKESYKPLDDKIEYIEIFDTLDLKNRVEDLLKQEEIDYFIHSMAVSDYTVDFVTSVRKITDNINNNKEKDIYDLICKNKDNFNDNKISSYEDDLIIKLKKTPKIISIIKDISPKTYLVGFKLLDSVSSKELIDVALKLKKNNKCDLVVANDLNSIRNGLHQAFIIKNDNEYITASGKDEIAEKLIDEMF